MRKKKEIKKPKISDYRLFCEAKPLSMALSCRSLTQPRWSAECVIGHLRVLSKSVKSNTVAQSRALELSDG